MLKLTYQDLKDILSERFERFNVTFDSIPYGDGENPNDYMEDDGRQYRIAEFTDIETGKEYRFQYSWHSEWETIFPEALMMEPEGVEWVKESIINPPKPVIEPEVVLTAEQMADKNLWKRYQETEGKREFTTLKNAGLKKSDIEEICRFLKTSFNIYQLRAKIIPICIEHKLEERSFWNYIQANRRKRK